MLGVKCLTTQSEMERMICSQIVDQLNQRILSKRIVIEMKIRNCVRAKLVASDVYKQLSSDSQLRGELGIPDKDAIANVVNEFCSSIVVWLNPLNTRQQGMSTQPFLIVKSIKVDEISKQVSSYVTAKGQSIDWLTWLLERGDDLIIAGFAYRQSNSFENQAGISRTGLGIMYKGGLRQWGVDPQYSGTSDDNFITRALVDLQDEIQGIVESEIG